MNSLFSLPKTVEINQAGILVKEEEKTSEDNNKRKVSLVAKNVISEDIKIQESKKSLGTRLIQFLKRIINILFCGKCFKTANEIDKVAQKTLSIWQKEPLQNENPKDAEKIGKKEKVETGKEDSPVLSQQQESKKVEDQKQNVQEEQIKVEQQIIENNSQQDEEPKDSKKIVEKEKIDHAAKMHVKVFAEEKIEDGLRMPPNLHIQEEKKEEILALPIPEARNAPLTNVVQKYKYPTNIIPQIAGRDFGIWTLYTSQNWFQRWIFPSDFFNFIQIPNDQTILHFGRLVRWGVPCDKNQNRIEMIDRMGSMLDCDYLYKVSRIFEEKDFFEGLKNGQPVSTEVTFDGAGGNNHILLKAGSGSIKLLLNEENFCCSSSTLLDGFFPAK